MAQELIYTSASRGLLPGSNGFCTVARTAGMSPVLVKLLESRSGYRHLFPPQSEKAGLNPVNWVHGTIRLGQTPTHILSRIGDAGLDYTKRSNMVAHHLILGPDELSACGPAAILAQSDLRQSGWDLPPTEFPQERVIPNLLSNPPVNPIPGALWCVHWEQAAGDAGWGGVLAESVLQSRSACVLYEPQTDLLPLFAESIALVPELLRWKITFSTYVREVPPGATFLWKGILAGTPEAEQVRATKGILLIDLTAIHHSTVTPKDNSAFVKVARTGIVAPPPIEDESQSVFAPPPIPEMAGSGPMAPPVDGGTYGIDESSTPKRKRFSVGAWSSQYESRLVSAERERKMKRIFFTIMGFSILAILVLLTLLGDEFFNSGGMRKGVLQSFGGLISRKYLENQDVEEDIPPEIPSEEEFEKQRLQEEEAEKQRLEKESQHVERLRLQKEAEEEEAERQRHEEEERQAELERLQKEAEEEHKRRQAEMREAFAAIPVAFELKEPREKAFGGIELPHNAQNAFAPLFPYRDYVQIQWISLVAPKGWRYHLEQVPPRFREDHAQWNLIARLVEGGTEIAQRQFNLASLRLGEDGLEIEWNSQTSGLESNREIVNKLPFSYLRFSFGPNEMTESGPKQERRVLPGPKRFGPSDDIAAVDFTKSVWFKDVSLCLPIQSKPVDFSDKGTTIARPVRFDNVFGRDRFRIALDKLDMQDALLLEVSVQPGTVKNVTAICEVSDVPWRKTISFTVESAPVITIPIVAEAFPDRIEFRDASREAEAEVSKRRTSLMKTIPELTDPQKVEDVNRELAQVREQFLAIPAARKSVLTAGFAIHYSVSLQGREGTEKMLILQTQ